MKKHAISGSSVSGVRTVLLSAVLISGCGDSELGVETMNSVKTIHKSSGDNSKLLNRAVSAEKTNSDFQSASLIGRAEARESVEIYMDSTSSDAVHNDTAGDSAITSSGDLNSALHGTVISPESNFNTVTMLNATREGIDWSHSRSPTTSSASQPIW